MIKGGTFRYSGSGLLAVTIPEVDHELFIDSTSDRANFVYCAVKEDEWHIHGYLTINEQTYEIHYILPFSTYTDATNAVKMWKEDSACSDSDIESEIDSDKDSDSDSDHDMDPEWKCVIQ